MADKVQKILSEIATRKLCAMDEHMAFYNDKAKEDYRFLSKIEEIIKGMQEDPVSEDLKEEIRKYLINYKGYPHVMDETEKEMVRVARHFAEWQKQKMMKNAVTITVSNVIGEGTEVGWIIKPSKKLIGDLIEGDKVKLIIIKEG